MEPFSIHSWEEVNSVHLSQVWKSLESVWWMLWWLQHHLWREGGTRGGPASSGVLGWMPVKHKSHLKTVVPDAIIKSVCVSLDRNMPSGGRFFRQCSSCSSSQKWAATSVQLSLCKSPSSVISSTLLRMCWETRQTFSWHQVWLCPSGWAARIGSRYSDMALAKSETREKSFRRDEETAMVCSHHLQNHFLFEGLLCCCLSGGPKLLKWFMSPNWTGWYPSILT